MYRSADLYRSLEARLQNAEVAKASRMVNRVLGHPRVTRCVWLSQRKCQQQHPPRSKITADMDPHSLPQTAKLESLPGHHLVLYLSGEYTRETLGYVSHTQSSKLAKKRAALKPLLEEDRYNLDSDQDTAEHRARMRRQRQHKKLLEKETLDLQYRTLLRSQARLLEITHACGEKCSVHAQVTDRTSKKGRDHHHALLRKALLARNVAEYKAIRRLCTHKPTCFLNLGSRKNAKLLARVKQTHVYKELLRK